MESTALFEVGRTFGTPGALSALMLEQIEPQKLIDRHVSGDFGELCEEDRMSNCAAIVYGGRVLSVYLLPSGVKVYVITDADRSTTTVLLPTEY
jgi:hypothetical protein